MAQFRHTQTTKIRKVTDPDEIGWYERQLNWDRLEDTEDDGEPEQTLDDIVEQLGHATAEHRNLLREALAQFEDADTAPDDDELFDPAAHSVAEVNDYLATLTPHSEDNPARVFAAEAEGQARKGILEGPHKPSEQPPSNPDAS